VVGRVGTANLGVAALAVSERCGASQVPVKRNDFRQWFLVFGSIALTGGM